MQSIQEDDRVQFAINYSAEAADLLRQGQIAPDRFKCPDWPDLIAAAQACAPVYVHFALRAGPGNLAATDWARVAALLEQSDTPCVNIHLAPMQSDMPHIPLDTTDPAHTAAVRERLLHDVGAVVEQFGAERVIVENVPYFGFIPDTYPILRPAAEPELIRQVLEETGCGLLLDLSHARIGARYLGYDEHAYLAALPTERLRELHITGLAELNGLWHDHMPMVEDDWPAFAAALEHIAAGDWARPWVVSFEYGGVGGPFVGRSEAAVIADQVPRLMQMMHAAAEHAA
jgi:uncharacterized protein (UPF0276 family)